MGVDESHFFIGGQMDVPELSPFCGNAPILTWHAADRLFNKQTLHRTDTRSRYSLQNAKVAVNWLFYFQGSNQYIA